MEYEDYCEDEGMMKNPNLYITLPISGGLWASTTYPWQESFPWTFNAPI